MNRPTGSALPPVPLGAFVGSTTRMATRVSAAHALAPGPESSPIRARGYGRTLCAATRNSTLTVNSASGVPPSCGASRRLSRTDPCDVSGPAPLNAWRSGAASGRAEPAHPIEKHTRVASRDFSGCVHCNRTESGRTSRMAARTGITAARREGGAAMPDRDSGPSRGDVCPCSDRGNAAKVLPRLLGHIARAAAPSPARPRLGAHLWPRHAPCS